MKKKYREDAEPEQIVTEELLAWVGPPAFGPRPRSSKLIRVGTAENGQPLFGWSTLPDAEDVVR